MLKYASIPNEEQPLTRSGSVVYLPKILNSRTSSTHSTRNPLVACGTGNLCEKSFSLVCRGDELLLYKCRTGKPCYN